MIEFNHRIVQFGFGAVGKSFFEKLQKADSTDISMKMLSKILVVDKIDEAENSVEFKLKVEN